MHRSGTPIRVLIVDDQRLVRAGLRVLVEQDEGLEVVGEAGDGMEAIALVERRRPDVVLMDVRMPVLDGLQATRRIVAEHGDAVAVLVLTTFDADEHVYEALRAGAGGFLLKDAPEEQLIEAIRVVAGGEAIIAPAVTRRLIERFVRVDGLQGGGSGADDARRAAQLAELTAREREVLALVARGLANAEIAEALVVSNHTIKTHVARTLMKLGLRDRVHLVVFAYESGFVVRGDDAQQRDVARESDGAPGARA
jgi:DNA-binding NarL/FixJ family response regulator